MTHALLILMKYKNQRNNKLNQPRYPNVIIERIRSSYITLFESLPPSQTFVTKYIPIPSLTPTFAYSWQSSYFPRFSYGLCVLQILFFLNGECFKFNLSYICFACFEGLLHWRISMFSPNGFFPFVVTSFWVLIRRTISVQ